MFELQHLVILGAIVSLSGSSVYFVNTLRGRSQPNRISMLMWALSPLIGFSIAISEGVTWAALPILIAGTAPVFIFCASFINPRAYWRLRPLDYISGALSLFALILWLAADAPLVALGLAVTSDVFATLPTLHKAWTYPESETAVSYITSTFNGLMAFTAISTWDFLHLAFPVYLVLSNGLLVYALYRKKFTRR